MGNFYLEVCARLIGQELNAPAVGGNVFMHDGQADATAAHRACRLALAPVKGLKDSRAIRLGHAAAFVVDLEADYAWCRGQGDANQAAHR